MDQSIRKTVLYDTHLSLDAKMVNFSGFIMPLQYAGIIAEHNTVRNYVGLFDLSHMGEFVISGGDAVAFLQKMTINDVSALKSGQAQYSALCNETGGIIDDCVIYRFRDFFLVVVNASNIVKDFNWLEQHISGNVSIADRSDDYSLLAVQGPNSLNLLRKIVEDCRKIESLSFYQHCYTSAEGIDFVCSRTGYTGELGYELYIDGSGIKKMWSMLMDQGADFGIQPIGIGARDTLRLEMKYCLYGNDIDEDTNPLEAGLGWITKLNKGDFIGRDILMQLKSVKPKRKLVGFEIFGRGIARHGYQVNASENESSLGWVTSGTYSPSLQKSIGMAYVDLDYSNFGNELSIDARGRVLKATIVKTPFWKEGSVAQKV